MIMPYLAIMKSPVWSMSMYTESISKRIICQEKNGNDKYDGRQFMIYLSQYHLLASV
jgi:hypothetical protein